jgi:hypothetical protein
MTFREKHCENCSRIGTGLLATSSLWANGRRYRIGSRRFRKSHQKLRVRVKRKSARVFQELKGARPKIEQNFVHPILPSSSQDFVCIFEVTLNKCCTQSKLFKSHPCTFIKIDTDKLYIASILRKERFAVASATKGAVNNDITFLDSESVNTFL